tara:strand:- start:626 stop:1021 length:396 start_codon:yes stop_codon:yes gene_type:complete
MSKYPDNVAWDDKEKRWVANILPYASNVGAPVIKPENIDSWRKRGVTKVNHHLETKFLELKDEYNKLVEEFKWNDLVYNAKFNFEPIVGEIYHLYTEEDGKNFLSLISPNEWDKHCLGSFKLETDQKWKKV